MTTIRILPRLAMTTSPRAELAISRMLVLTHVKHVLLARLIWMGVRALRVRRARVARTQQKLPFRVLSVLRAERMLTLIRLRRVCLVWPER